MELWQVCSSEEWVAFMVFTELEDSVQKFRRCIRRVRMQVDCVHLLRGSRIFQCRTRRERCYSVSAPFQWSFCGHGGSFQRVTSESCANLNAMHVSACNCHCLHVFVLLKRVIYIVTNIVACNTLGLRMYEEEHEIGFVPRSSKS